MTSTRRGRGVVGCGQALAAALVLLATPLSAGTLKGYLAKVEGQTLVVGEQVVTLSPSTRVERRSDPGFATSGLRPGFEVEIDVEDHGAGTGPLTARRLKVLTPPSEPIEIEGFVERIGEGTLRVDGWSVAWPQGLAREDVRLGMDLAGAGELRDDGTVRLRSFKLRLPKPDDDARAFSEEAKASLADLRDRLRAASDPELSEYVARVGRQVAPDLLKGTPGSVAFYVVRDDEPNAFALPDGTIVVHSGLFDVLANEAQLACVLGHELAHVTHEHAFRHQKRSRRLGVITMVASAVASGIAAVLLDNGAAASLFGSLNDLGSDLMLTAAVNGYGRELEDDADRIGLGYAFDAGYDPYQSVEVWRTLSQRVKDRSRAANWFFGDHATHRARIAHLTKELDTRYRRSVVPGALARNEDAYRQTLAHAATARAEAPRRATGIATGCLAGDEDVARALAGEGSARDALLMSAVQTCPVAVVQRLIEQGANANPQANAQGITPLGLALISGKWDVAELLVERGARLETAEIDALFFERPTDPKQRALLERAEQKETPR